ncbi:hypothetical protein [Streptomyces sp. NPDC006012]|uniref:hypothetical protein n=1 Tax=Streptomyces sp. NPDC006012 TaxID=3364739 RepID=UPI0036B9A5E3
MPKKSQTMDEYWVIFEKVYDNYYADPSRRNQLPPYYYAPEIDGIKFPFGRNMRKFLKKGGDHKTCPDRLKTKIQLDNPELFNDESRAATNEGNKGRRAAFEKAVQKHYQDPDNLGSLPSKSKKDTIDGVTVNYGQSWNRWRKHGYPKNMSDPLRKTLDGYEQEAEVAHLAALQWPTGQGLPESSSGQEVTGAVDYSAADGVSQTPSEFTHPATEHQGDTMSAGLPQSELTEPTSPYPFSQVAQFASMPVETQPTDTFSYGTFPGADSSSAAFLPDDYYNPQMTAGVEFQTPDANSYSQDHGNMMGSGLSPSGHLPWNPTYSLAPLVPQPADSADSFAPEDLLDTQSYSTTDYTAALNLPPTAQTQAYPTDRYSSQSGHTPPRPFSPAHRGQRHSSGARGMRR